MHIEETIKTMKKMSWRERYRIYADYIADLEMPEYNQDSLDFSRWLSAIESHVLDMPETPLNVQEVLYLYIVERANVSYDEGNEQCPDALSVIEGDWCTLTLNYEDAHDDAQEWFMEMEYLYNMWADKVEDELADCYTLEELHNSVPTIWELNGGKIG